MYSATRRAEDSGASPDSRSAATSSSTEAAGRAFAYNVPMNYSAVRLMAEAIEKAGAPDRRKIIEALSTQSFASGVMPYGQSKFVNGQNTSALPLNTRVQGGDVTVIAPADFAQAKANFPFKA